MADVTRNLNLLKLVIIGIGVIIVATHVWYWAWPESFAYISSGDELISKRGGIEPLETWQRVLGFAVNFLPKAFLVYALVCLFKLTSLLLSGQWFDLASQLLCRRVGRILLVYILLEILQRTLLILVITATYPAGKKELLIELSSRDLAMLVPALLALIFSHMIHLARLQRDELSEII